MKELKKIYLGAGLDRKNGFTHVDILDLPGIDLVWNLADFPWPFEDESADEVLAIDVLEHMPMHTKDNEVEPLLWSP